MVGLTYLYLESKPCTANPAAVARLQAKAVTATIRLVIPAGQAKPSPPVGPALGQAGLKIMDFCKDFNAKTAEYKVRRRRRGWVPEGTS